MLEIEAEDVLMQTRINWKPCPRVQRADNEWLSERRHGQVVRAFRVERKERGTKRPRVQTHQSGVYRQPGAGSL
jgi:hypothetical protein